MWLDNICFESFYIYLELFYIRLWAILVNEITFVHIKRICIHLLLGQVFYKYQLSQVGWYCSYLLYSHWFFVYSSINYQDTSIKISDYNYVITGSSVLVIFVLCIVTLYNWVHKLSDFVFTSWFDLFIVMKLIFFISNNIFLKTTFSNM